MHKLMHACNNYVTSSLVPRLDPQSFQRMHKKRKRTMENWDGPGDEASYEYVCTSLCRII